MGGMDTMDPVSPEYGVLTMRCPTHFSFYFSKFITIFALKYILYMNMFYYYFYLRIVLNL